MKEMGFLAYFFPADIPNSFPALVFIKRAASKTIFQWFGVGLPTKKTVLIVLTHRTIDQNSEPQTVMDGYSGGLILECCLRLRVRDRGLYSIVLSKHYM